MTNKHGTEGNTNFDKKIVAGVERVSQILKTLLWEKAKEQHLSPVQIQLLIFIQYHSSEKTSISYLAEEFQVSKPTISDAIRVLEQKNLVAKCCDQSDNRRYSIALTETGRKVVLETENYTSPILNWTTQLELKDKEALWVNISNLIHELNKAGVITVQRTCYTCRYYNNERGYSFCGLLSARLHPRDIQIDCPDYIEGTDRKHQAL